MKLSQAAADFAGAAQNQPFGFLKFGDLGAFVRERHLNPGSGRAVAIPGIRLRALLRAESMVKIERQVNDLGIAIRDAGVEKDVALREAIDKARASTDSFELHYMTSIFLHQKAVLRALARNPGLAERTQLQIAQDSVLVKDRETVLALAHNPALTARVMRVLLASNQDPYVWQGVARNASFQSRQNPADRDFSGVCEELVQCWDGAVATAAIGGLKNGDLLRSLYDQSNTLLSPERLGEIAQNPHTPDDVLEKMSQSRFAGVQRALGMSFPEQARLTLSAKQKALRQENDTPSYSM